MNVTYFHGLLWRMSNSRVGGEKKVYYHHGAEISKRVEKDSWQGALLKKNPLELDWKWIVNVKLKIDPKKKKWGKWVVKVSLGLSS
jgi:hypothetical protein